MFSIRLQNFRSLVDTDYIELRPLTLLVGRNSSGKSTLTRFFPLLRQSVEVQSSAPLLWYGSLVDFGNISDVCSRLSDADSLRFDIRLPLDELGEDLPPRRRYIDSTLKEITFGLTLSEHDGETRVSAIHLDMNDDKIDIHVGRNNKILNLYFNENDILEYLTDEPVRVDTSHLVPPIVRISDSRHTEMLEYFMTRRVLQKAPQQIIRFYKQHLHGNFTEDNIDNLARRIRYTNTDAFSKAILETGRDYTSWISMAKHLSRARQKNSLEYLRSLYFLRDLPEYLIYLDRIISSIFRRVGYIGPTRATGERYYRIQELAVDRVDPRGENLAMFINSLSRNQQTEFELWTEEYLGYAVSAKRTAGHVSLMIREAASSQEYNLADVGYGISQVLPVFAQIWAQTSIPSRQSSSPRKKALTSVLAIEQPELHLHPAYQARIADALVGALHTHADHKRALGASGLALLVETHSRQLINRIGEIIENGQLRPQDVAIYLFDRTSPDSATIISRARFNKQGVLTKWPYGFFSAHE